MSYATEAPQAVIPIPRRDCVLRVEPHGSSEAGSAQPEEELVPINWDEIYNLKGRLLTIVDATFTDREQRKAFKNVVWSELQDWIRDREDVCGYEGDRIGKTLVSDHDLP